MTDNDAEREALADAKEALDRARLQVEEREMQLAKLMADIRHELESVRRDRDAARLKSFIGQISDQALAKYRRPND